MPDNRVKVLYPTSDGWQILLEGLWHTSGRKLFIRFENNAYGPIEREEDVWTINAVGTDCFIAKDSSSRPCILQRVKRYSGKERTF